MLTTGKCITKASTKDIYHNLRICLWKSITIIPIIKKIFFYFSHMCVCMRQRQRGRERDRAECPCWSVEGHIVFSVWSCRGKRLILFTLITLHLRFLRQIITESRAYYLTRLADHLSPQITPFSMPLCQYWYRKSLPNMALMWMLGI